MYFICTFKFCQIGFLTGSDIDRSMVVIFSVIPVLRVPADTIPFSCNFEISIEGQYDSLEEARQQFLGIYPEHRAVEDDDVVPLTEAYDGVVDVFKLGKYAQLGGEESLTAISDDMVRDITASTSDDEIEQLWDAYQHEVNQYGYLLDACIQHVLLDYRDDLRDR